MKKEAGEANKCEMKMTDSSEQDTNLLKHVMDDDHRSTKGEVMEQSPGANNEGVTGEVNMEAAITADDVMRAGGFGARDDIGSFLPVAIDSTDFEASLRDARDFEEPQGEIPRPGLGWKESMDEN